MASYQYQYQQQQHQQQHTGHHGQHRSRRGPRVSSQNAHRQYKMQQRSPKEMPAQEQPHQEYMLRLEAAMSFDWEDDSEFCPFNLLTEDDLHSIHSTSASDRGSMSSGSPESSPQQHQVHPTPSFLLSNASNTFNPTPTGFQPTHHMKLHQPMAQRTRNAIPIVDPNSRSAASPPLSVSPARQMQQHFVPRRAAW